MSIAVGRWIATFGVEGVSVWRPFNNGTTVGQHGSENGVILRDEEHDSGARITLEHTCSHGVPFAVTCGIYGWFFHTRLLGSEAEAEWSLMLEGLSAILDTIPRADDAGAEAKCICVSEAIQAFVARFP